CDPQPHDLRVGAQRRPDLLDERRARPGQLEAGELDRVERLDPIGRQDERRIAVVGAAVVILVAVDRVGVVRTLVLLIGDAVVIVVGIGAPVGVLEAVLVLGIERALVLHVGDDVVIVIGIGAAIAVLEAVLVFR